MRTFRYIMFLTAFCLFLPDKTFVFAGGGKKKKNISTYNKHVIEPANTGNQSFGRPVAKILSQSVLIDSMANGYSMQSYYTNQIYNYPTQNAIVISHRGDASYSGTGRRGRKI